MLEIVGAFRCGEGRDDRPNSATQARNCSFSGLAQMCLQFAEGLFDRVEVGRILRKVAQRCSNSFDGVPNACDLVSGKIVHDDDIATIEGRSQTLLDIADEGRSVHWPIYHEGRNHPIISQTGHEGDRFPMPVRRVANQSRAPWAPPSKSHHLSGGGGLVDKHQPGRVKHALLSIPAPARAGHVCSVMLRGAQAFFLKVTLCRM
jgi:hypothetical protein